DGAGEVVEVGAGVTRVKPGDRVMAAFMQKWVDGELTEDGMRSALGAGGEAVGAEYVVLDQEGLVVLPVYLSFEEAASLPCAGVTAWHSLVSEGHVRAGETVLTLGTGGVSIFAVQFAKLMGARVIATSSKADKIERLQAMGADQTINYVEQPDWHKIARGVDHVVEVGGKDTLPKSLRAVRPGGSVYVIGVLSGRGDLDFTPVFMRNIRLQGIFVGSRVMAEDMLRAMAAHELRPVIDRVFELGEAREALRYMESGAHFGKIVLRDAS
ncbi:MAG: NAD(P)-dependent alcohol dehydrogenase, partial [Bryobacteraceae bacterium]|nr:NAD(P)-dependent alcohol dehydrogenase [Bryobacteraceae bacterium]